MFITKYNKSLINDYVMCNNIDDKIIEKLEDEAGFMREVLMTTDDPKMYYFCSNRLKKDIEFNMFAIEYFISKNIDVNNIVCSYFKLLNDEIKRKEFEIKLCELSLKYFHNAYLKKYRDLVTNSYINEMKSYQKSISKINDKKLKNYYGVGFFCIMNKYSKSDNIKNFYAKNIFEDIILSYKIESDLHKKFESANEVLEYGVNRYLLSIIGVYDRHLENYLMVNYNLMKNETAKINTYLKRWDEYDMQHVNYVLKKINEYFNKKNHKNLPRNNAIAYSVKKLNLQKIFSKSNLFNNSLKVIISKPSLLNENNLEVSEMITLLEIEKYLRKEILGEKEVACGDYKNLIKVDFENNKKR